MLFQSDKKNFNFQVNICKSGDKLKSFVNFYQPDFVCHRYDNAPTALEYILGLITCEKTRQIWKGWGRLWIPLNTEGTSNSSPIQSGTMKGYSGKSKNRPRKLWQFKRRKTDSPPG